MIDDGDDDDDDDDICHTGVSCKMAEPIEMQFEFGGGNRLAWVQGAIVFDGAHIGATWRIQLNEPAMRAVAKFTVATCC